MLLEEVIDGKRKKIHPILQDCSQFLEESENLPLLKNLSINYNDFDKVKIRQRKHKDKFTHTFNEAFKQKTFHIRQRSLFANGTASFIKENDMDAFFVFPIDGYKFMYSMEVTNSRKDYQDAFDTILESVDDKEVLKDLLKYTYTSENIAEGIGHGSEIIIYNIPYYYAIRSSTVESYMNLIDTLEQY